MNKVAEAIQDFGDVAFDAIEALQAELRELRAELAEKERECEALGVALRRALDHMDGRESA